MFEFIIEQGHPGPGRSSRNGVREEEGEISKVHENETKNLVYDSIEELKEPRPLFRSRLLQKSQPETKEHARILIWPRIRRGSCGGSFFSGSKEAKS